MFESKMIALLQKINVKTIIEFGSFDGKDAIKYRNWFPDADIYSCEPNPYIFDKFEENVKDFNINCCRIAFGNTTCSKDITLTQGKVNNAYTDGSTFLIPNIEYKNSQSHLYFREKVIKVEMTTLDKFFKKHKIDNVDFIHMNVGGYIPEVMDGINKIKPTVIYAKVIGNEKMFLNALNYKQCSEIFKKIGYEEILIDDNNGFVVYILRNYIKNLFSQEQINLFDILTKGKSKVSEINELASTLSLGRNKIYELTELVGKLKGMMESKRKGPPINDKETMGNMPIKIINNTFGVAIGKSVIKSIIDRLHITDIIEEHIEELLKNRGGIKPLIIFAEIAGNEDLLMGMLDQKQCSKIFEKIGREKILMGEVDKTVVYILKKYINDSFPLEKINSVDILSQGRDKINELIGLSEKLKITLSLIDDYFKSKLLK